MALEAIGGGAATFLLPKLDSFIRKHAALIRGVGEKVREMKRELEDIKSSVSQVANSCFEEVAVSERLKLWIRDLREVAYDIEEVLDEYALLLDGHPPNKAAKLHKHYGLGRKMTKIAGQLHSICERKNKYDNGQLVGYRANDGLDDPREDPTLDTSKDQIVGIEDHVDKLKEWLKGGDSKPAIISVVGMAGLGKTTLVRQVYDDDDVKNRFDCHAWVKVWPSLTINDEHLRQMMAKFYTTSRQGLPEGISSMSGNLLEFQLKHFLREKRYVLVLDDVWSINSLTYIKNTLCDGKVSSRIMVTTRILNVETCSEVYRLEPLPLQQAWSLFYKRAFPPVLPPPPIIDQFDNLAWGIVEKWQGLPLAVVLVGSLLRSKGMVFNEWERMNSSIASESASDAYKIAMRILSFSYNCLPYNLKYCFLCLGIFPEGKLIKRMKLIRLWMAEGFLEKNDHKTMEDFGEEHFNHLTNHSLIQVAERSYFGRVISYRVNPLMREFILMKSKEENFCVFSLNRIIENTQKIHRLSIPNSGTGDALHDLSSLPHVRSFFAPELPGKKFLSKFEFLKVLDLENAPMQDFPESLTKLYFLRYLSLENTQIRELPKSLGNLVNLEIMNLKDTSVSELPRQIVKLKHMRHLLVYRHILPRSFFDCINAVKLPVGISWLTSLQNLAYVDANGNRGTVREMGNLTQLRRLGVVGLRAEDGYNMCSSISNMKFLQSLSTKSINENELLDLEHLTTPPPDLRGLKLQGWLEKLPKWIFGLHNLTRLTLAWSRLKEDPFFHLGTLPALVELKLIEAYYGERLYSGQYKEGSGFSNLKFLHLDGLHELQTIDVTMGALASLETLEIRCCKALRMLPSGIEHITKLEKLILQDMPTGFIKHVRMEESVRYKLRSTTKVEIFEASK